MAHNNSCDKKHPLPQTWVFFNGIILRPVSRVLNVRTDRVT